MKLKKVVFSVLSFGLGLTGLQAQEATPATGGVATSNAGSVSYSVGQILYTNNTGVGGSEAQGVQQPYEISEVTGVYDTKEYDLSISVYPNPTTDFLILKVERDYVENLSYQLFDVNGKLIENKKIEGNETSIPTSNFEPAIYFLQVTEGNKEVKKFKIIKN